MPQRLHFLRQQADKPPGRPGLLPRRFHRAARRAGVRDWIGAFAVTAGLGIDAHVARFEAAHDDYSSILLKALADRLAEALAEAPARARAARTVGLCRRRGAGHRRR